MSVVVFMVLIKCKNYDLKQQHPYYYHCYYFQFLLQLPILSGITPSESETLENFAVGFLQTDAISITTKTINVKALKSQKHHPQSTHRSTGSQCIAHITGAS